MEKLNGTSEFWRVEILQIVSSHQIGLEWPFYGAFSQARSQVTRPGSVLCDLDLCASADTLASMCLSSDNLPLPAG